MGAPLPVNEEDRLNTLYGMNVLDTNPDSLFDDITRLVSTIFKVPIAIVSLVDTQRQWFKSVMGLPCTSTDRTSSFCAWTLLPVHPEVLVVEDTTKDARFKSNPLVKAEPFIRFYAGAPLVSSVGHRLGSLCIIDRQSRTFDAESCNVLCNFAEIVVRQIEKTNNSLMAQYAVSQQARNLLRALNCFSEGLMLCQMTVTGWKVLYVNDAWVSITGVPQELAMNRDLWDLFEPTDSCGGGRSTCVSAVRLQTDFQLTATTSRPGDESGKKSHLVLNFRPAHLDPLDGNMPLIGIPGNVPWDRDANVDEPYYFATCRHADDVISLDIQPFCEVEGADAFPEVVLGPLLGKGSFGKVYRGIWKGVPVAIKVMQASLSDAGKDKPGAQLEAAVSMSIAHPNVVQTYKTASRQCAQAVAARPEFGGGSPFNGQNGPSPGGLWRVKDTPMETVPLTEVWILLEFCDMGTLVDAVERGWLREGGQAGRDTGPTSLQAVVLTAREVASALQYLHSMDIVHGDLSGNNVMLVSSSMDPRGFSSKVADFGLSRVVNDGTIRTETFGTATHMPPELLTKGLCSKAIDVYAYGVLLWEMWNARRAWGGMHQLQVIFNVTVQNRKLEFGPDAPPLLVDIAQRCMDSDPDRRPTFEQVLSLLEKIEV